MLPGLLQPSSQSAITAPNGHAWPSQPPPGLAAEQPPIATVEASEILQVGSNTTVAPPPQPPRYAAPTTLRRSHMTTSLTELSPVGGTGTVAAGSSLGPVGSLGSVPPAPSTSTMPYAPTVPGWAGRGPPGSLLRRPNMPVMDAHGFGSSAGSIMTTASRQPYFATSMTEAPGSVAISSVGVIECPSPRNSLAGMPPASRPLRSPPPRRSLSPGQLSTRPPPMGRRFAPPYGEEIRRRPPSGVDFLDQDRIDEGYDSVETVGGRRDSHPPLSRLPASNVDFRYRERIDEGYDSTETVSRQPAPRRLEPTVSRSGRRQMNASSRPVAGSKSGSGPHVSRIRMFQIERDRGAAPAEAETRKLTYETHDGTHDVSSAASHGQPYQPQLSDIPDDSSYDDYGPSRPRVCNCPGTVMIRRGPPRRSTSGRLRGAYIRNDDDDDVMDDLYMIKMSKKKKKRKQPPPPPVAPAPSGGLLGFLSGLVGGRQPPPPPPRQADSDSDDESDFELRRFDRRQLENLVRRMEMKQAASEDESKEGRKAKKQEEKKPEENKSEEKKPEEKKPEEEKPEDKPPEPEKKEEKPPEAQVGYARLGNLATFGCSSAGGPGSGKGTQCDKIVAKYGFTHISSGDLLRAEVASGSDRGKQIDDIMKQGALAPLTMILQLIKETMQKDLPTAKGFLLDGYPRNVEQGERFEAEVCKCTNLIYFEVSDDTMKARILKRGQTSGRVDDNADTAVKRIKTFHDESQPVLDKYKDIVHKISAEDDPDKVFASVSAVMDEMLKPK
ncbi:hypothetical protein HPB52_021535 [Rhipicephalus sanguineus]|uniref:Adenylate kinase n=1 Tax=Rhipicephalus sanguineus TaxID=34632 RepID=A0A9D4TBQ7_RHISA|nr:hypothetical protein HPB52_021535 [Rhipicephalus sanguineus]